MIQSRAVYAATPSKRSEIFHAQNRGGVRRGSKRDAAEVLPPCFSENRGSWCRQRLADNFKTNLTGLYSQSSQWQSQSQSLQIAIAIATISPPPIPQSIHLLREEAREETLDSSASYAFLLSSKFLSFSSVRVPFVSLSFSIFFSSRHRASCPASRCAQRASKAPSTRVLSFGF